HEADPDRWPEERRRFGRILLSGTHRALLTAAAFSIVPAPTWSLGRAPWVLLRAALAIGISAFAWLAGDSPFYLVAVVSSLVWSLSGPVLRWAQLSLLGTLITHAVFFGEDRYHIIVTPMLCLLAAGALRKYAENTCKDLPSTDMQPL